MIKLWRELVRPEYLFRPHQLARRVWRRYGSHTGFDPMVRLPWGLDLRLDPNEAIGAAVWYWGVYDLAVSEAIWRLLDPGEHAADVGANTGYMTSIMAARAGARGRVTAFEPHPDLHAELMANVQRWPVAAAPVTTVQAAISTGTGMGRLRVPAGFASNRGLATLAEDGDLEVPLRRLDETWAPGEAPALIKIDVEGHEAQVLAGGQALFSGRTVRDVVFEDHGSYPGVAAAALDAYGYALFRLGKGLLGPRLLPPTAPASPGEAPSLLATADPGRARARFRARGWAVLWPRLWEPA